MMPAVQQAASRLALVGCGAAAKHCHLPGLARTSGIELTALVDPHIRHAKQLASDYARGSGLAGHVEILHNVDALAGKVDLAVVAAPHVYHAELVVRLAELGIHTLVEKPMALTVEECDCMAAAARRHRVVLGVAFVRRLFPASVWIKRVLSSGRIGAVRRIHWQEGAPYDWPLVSPSLFVYAVAGGGVVIDCGSHVFDLIFWWLGAQRTDSIEYRDSSVGGTESEARLHLVIRGIPVSVELSRLRLAKNTGLIEGEHASVEFGIDLDAPYTLRDALGRVIETGIVAAAAPAQSEWELLFTEQLRNFAASARGEEEIYAGAEDGRAVTALIEACYSARKPLPLPWREVRVP